MNILISFILSLYITAFIYLLFVINKLKHRIHELEDMNKSLSEASYD